MKLLYSAALALCLALAACNDTAAPKPPADPCSLKGACEVHGVDLVIDTFALWFPSFQPFDQAQQLPWFEAGDSLYIQYRIRNRGDERSDSTVAWVGSCQSCSGSSFHGAPVRSLAPGETDSGTVRLPVPGAGVQHATISLDAVKPVDDPFYRNNVASSSNSYMVVPLVHLITDFSFTGELRAGKTVRVALSLFNNSARHTLPDTTIGLCIRRTDWGYPLPTCYAVVKTKVPHLAPGAEWKDTLNFTVGALDRFAAVPVRFDACLGGNTVEAAACVAGVVTKVLPDADALCPAPQLQPGTPVTFTYDPSPYNCFANNALDLVFSFEGKSQHVYIASYVADPNSRYAVSIWDRNGNAIGPSQGLTAWTYAPSDGRYYVVLRRYYNNNEKITLTLTDQH